MSFHEYKYYDTCTAPLICGYKKNPNLNPLPVDIYLQYSLPIRCEFYLWIHAGTKFFGIPNCIALFILS